MKKVLIIGAGFLQSFIIKKVKEMGYYTLAVDPDTSAPGFAYADKFEYINIVNQEACLAFAKENQIDGVLTAATEYGVLTASYIAQEMKLPGLDYASAKKVKNKYLVRRSFIENHVDDGAGPCYQVDADTDINELAQTLTYPVMVKPCDGSGSRGTHRVDGPDDLVEACTFAINSSITHYAFIEPFVFGREYGAEALVVKGDIHVLAIMKKVMTEPPYYAELGHAIPCGLLPEIEDRAKKCVERAISSLGINSGAVNVDMLISDEGKIYIVDIGARMGGNMIGACVIPYGTGIDYMGAIIQTALGETVDLSVHTHKAVATKLLAFKQGVVKRLPDFAKIEKDYGVEIYHHMKKGDTVNEYHTNLDGCGYVVAKADSMECAEQAAEKVLGYISDYCF